VRTFQERNGPCRDRPFPNVAQLAFVLPAILLGAAVTVRPPAPTFAAPGLLFAGAPIGVKLFSVVAGTAAGGAMWRGFVVLGVAIGTAGCAAHERQSRMIKALDDLVGQSIADFVAERGDPTSSVKLGEGENAFRWC
jgi:hypothetical protein